jgi:hypothetical protein
MNSIDGRLARLMHKRERHWSRVGHPPPVQEPVPDWRQSDCQIWQGDRGGKHDGYGRFRRAGKWVRAHRLAWEQANGPIPDGMLVCHHCDVPLCINPKHLFLGTHQDNTDDMVRKGRQPSHW